MNNKLIIFDCDGVLVDSEYLSNIIFIEMLASHGVTITLEESIRKFTGFNEEDVREIVSKESGITLPQNYWASQLPKLHQAYERDLTALMQPFLEILEVLNLPRCVASNSPPHHIETCLKISQQFNYFPKHALFSAQQVEKPKPAPDLFLFAANQMGFKPENCIVVEDSHAGTQAAIAAGMEVMIFLAGNHARYDWYHESMKIYNKPIVSNCLELLAAVQAKTTGLEHQ